MNAREHRVAVADVAKHERDMLFAVAEIFVGEDLEVAELRGQLRPRHFAHDRCADGRADPGPDCLKDVQRLTLLAYSI